MRILIMIIITKIQVDGNRTIVQGNGKQIKQRIKTVYIILNISGTMRGLNQGEVIAMDTVQGQCPDLEVSKEFPI